MGKRKTFEQNSNAGPAPALLSELAYNDLLTGAKTQVSPRILESLPWRKVNDFLAAVGAERSIEGLARRVLLEIGSLLPCDSVGFVVGNPIAIARPDHQSMLSVGFPSWVASEYYGHYIAKDPCASLYPSTARGAVDWMLHNGEFFHDFGRRVGSQQLVASDFRDTVGVGFLVSLHRMRRSGFNEREKATAFTLRPHLRNLVVLVNSPEKLRRERVSAAVSMCGLTPREQDVVLLLCDRLSADEIAERLTISRRTVEKHIEHVYLKLGVHGRRGLHEETVLGDALADALEDRKA